MRPLLMALSPRLKEHNLTLVAAGVAFYAFLALVPALVAFISIYGLAANPEDVTRQVRDVASALRRVGIDRGGAAVALAQLARRSDRL